MSGLEPILLIGGTLLSVVGQIDQAISLNRAAKAQEVAGRHARALAERRAEAQEQQAGQERAVSQRAAIEQRRQGRFVESRIQAVSAASGAGALDPTIVGILGDVGVETEVGALNALFEGEEAARGLEFGASLTRAGGEGELFASRQKAAALRASASRSFLTAGGTLLSGGASLFDKFPDFFNFRGRLRPGNPLSTAAIPPVGRRRPPRFG